LKTTKEAAKSEQTTTTEVNLDDLVRLEADTMPTIPRRKNSASSFDLLAFPDESDYLEDESNHETSGPASDIKPKKVSKSKKVSKKSKEIKATGGKTLPEESAHSVDSVSKKKGTKTKAGGGAKAKKSKKKSKKMLDEPEPSSNPPLDHKSKKTKKKGKKKKPKDSERSKLDVAEYGSQLKNDGTLKKSSKKKRSEDSEPTAGTNETDCSMKARTTRKKAEKKSDRSTFEVGELPDLKDIGVLKKRDSLDASNHSVQSAFEFGSSGQKVHVKRSSRSRKSDLDSSNHSVKSCLEIETMKLFSPKPSALSTNPIRPAFRPKDTVKKTKRKSVTFADGEPTKPPITIPRKEMTRDWGEASLDRLPSMLQRTVSSQSPPSLPHRRVSQGRIDPNEVTPVPKPPRSVHHSPPSRDDGVNFLLNRLSTTVHYTDSEAPRNNDVAPRMPRPNRLSQESPELLSPTQINELPVPSTPVLSTPKVCARDKLGLKRVEEPASKLVTPTGRILGKQRMEKRRTESSVRKGEVLEAMHTIMIDESPDEE
jgi:hypothetical protein